MKQAARLRFVGTLTVAGAFALSSTPALAGQSHEPEPRAYTCAGGEIPSGNYERITVTGACSVAAGAVIRVSDDVKVTAGAALDAQSAPSTITVGGDVKGARGSTVGLGCQPPSATGNSAHECALDPTGQSTITVKGDVKVTNGELVALNGIKVRGDVTLTGGGGPNYWSIKNNTIGRNLKIEGVTADWLGVLFNIVGGNVSLTDISATDPGDPGRLVFVVRNVIGKNLSCENLSPGVSGGFFPGSVNVVGGRALGQCSALV